MTTDNRTNEPTPEQVEAAAKAAYEFDADVSELFGRGFTRDFGGMPQWAKDTHLDKARAALVAAQGAAPQAQSEYVYCPIHGDLLAARRSFVCEHAEKGHEYAAQAQPSSTVDEAALIREAKAEALEEASLAYGSGKLSGIFLGRDDYPKAWLRARAAEYRKGEYNDQPA